MCCPGIDITRESSSGASVSRRSAEADLADPVILAVGLSALRHRLPVVLAAHAAHLYRQDPADAGVPVHEAMGVPQLADGRDHLAAMLVLQAERDLVARRWCVGRRLTQNVSQPVQVCAPSPGRISVRDSERCTPHGN